jgi:hypothetical protein
VEYVLALSVIAGLMFVSVRIMTRGMPAATVTQTEALQGPDTAAAEVKLDASAPTAEAPEAKAP